MKTIKNTTQRPLRVPLPRNKTVHLGPGKTGQITAESAEHPGLKKLVEAGQLELVDEGPAGGMAGGGGSGGGSARHGHGGGGMIRRSGDR